MLSLWEDSIKIEKYNELNEDIWADVAIIGAGIAGILTGYMLMQKGIKPVILEADRVLSGMTKNTTAKITYQHGLIYDKLIKNFGVVKATQYYKFNKQAIREYEKIIFNNKIDCDFEKKSSCVYSLNDEKCILNEVVAAKRLGINAEFVKDTELPFKIKAGIIFKNQAQFNPLKFLKPLLQDLDIYENCVINKIVGDTLYSDKYKINARKIVIASHYPFVNVPGYYFLRMHQERSYVIAIQNAQSLKGMYIDEQTGGYSFREYNNLLLLGGSGCRTGKNKNGGAYDKLRQAAKIWYPNYKEKYHWSAQDCMPLDSVPYIGQFSSKTPHIYIATGFNKWGMTSSMVAARLISEMISTGDNDIAGIFSPQRFNFKASIKNLIKDGTCSAAGLIKTITKRPNEEIENLQAGHGGIVKYNGQKVGAYKNENGEIFIVTTKCPHLGCQLEWNPDELCWECPCHGSRFDYKGNTISGPSTTGITLDYIKEIKK